MSKVQSILVAGAMGFCLIPAHAADQILSGSIVSQSGQTLEGVTVSAKLEGSTITTSVYSDTTGIYIFPPLPPGKYRVWAQA
ncbi:MAG: carboxypeptidase-like regulatory domain-containing protein, partial [Burkholderiales bacterium]